MYIKKKKFKLANFPRAEPKQLKIEMLYYTEKLPFSLLKKKREKQTLSRTVIREFPLFLSISDEKFDGQSKSEMIYTCGCGFCAQVDL